MDDFEELSKKLKFDSSSTESLFELQNVKVRYLGKNGLITSQAKLISSQPPEKRKEFGNAVNVLKGEAAEILQKRAEELAFAEANEKLAGETADITLDPRPEQQGSIHPISQVIDECIAIFGAMGFTVAEGPDIEDDFHNFNALNIPENHPARQMHDTFYFPSSSLPLEGGADESNPAKLQRSGGSSNRGGEKRVSEYNTETTPPRIAFGSAAPPSRGSKYLLRTHTSPVQIRFMQANKPPYKIIAPGRTYRCDSDMTHSPMFHQIEGLFIDKNITMAHLKGCLTEFVHIFFGQQDIPLRFRPSFFPFTEPSAEVDIGCSWNNGELKLGATADPKDQQWLEILGCGMVNPKVLAHVNVDAQEWQGFAFGMGIERIAMLKYGIPDLRTFFDSDVRWLEHYGFAALDVPNGSK